MALSKLAEDGKRRRGSWCRTVNFMEGIPAVSRLRYTFASVLILSAIAVQPALAAAPTVTSTLAVYKIVAGADGHEAKVSAERAEAGATLQYELTYHNQGASPIKGLVATLPIPGGTAYIGGTSRPGDIQASLDGNHFAPPPLQREEKGADGITRVVVVPAADYRYLRWSVGVLQPGERRTLVARVHILRGHAGSH